MKSSAAERTITRQARHIVLLGELRGFCAAATDEQIAAWRQWLQRKTAACRRAAIRAIAREMNTARVLAEVEVEMKRRKGGG